MESLHVQVQATHKTLHEVLCQGPVFFFIFLFFYFV